MIEAQRYVPSDVDKAWSIHLRFVVDWKSTSGGNTVTLSLLPVNRQESTDILKKLIKV